MKQPPHFHCIKTENVTVGFNVYRGFLTLFSGDLQHDLETMTLSLLQHLINPNFAVAAIPKAKISKAEAQFSGCHNVHASCMSLEK